MAIGKQKCNRLIQLCYAGHVLADSCEGETVLIPPQVIAYSIAQKPAIDENKTLRFLGSPKENVAQISTAQHDIDYIIR